MWLPFDSNPFDCVLQGGSLYGLLFISFASMLLHRFHIKSLNYGGDDETILFRNFIGDADSNARVCACVPQVWLVRVESQCSIIS